jgi:hypothetical protein
MILNTRLLQHQPVQCIIIYWTCAFRRPPCLTHVKQSGCDHSIIFIQCRRLVGRQACKAFANCATTGSAQESVSKFGCSRYWRTTAIGQLPHTVEGALKPRTQQLQARWVEWVQATLEAETHVDAFAVLLQLLQILHSMPRCMCIRAGGE